MINTKSRRSTPIISVLDSDARVWVFQSSEEIVEGPLNDISQTLDAFLAEWAAHGSDLYAGFDILHDRFIIIAVDEKRSMASGCSIDSMMKVIQEIDLQYKLSLLNRMKVAYIAGDKIHEEDVNEFTKMLNSGVLNENTVVFDNTIQSLGELYTKWEVPVKDCWCANLIQ